MATDVKALFILSEQIDNFRKLPEPPTSFGDAETYTITLKKASGVAQKALENVKRYLEKVEEKVAELRTAQQALVKQNQDAIEKVITEFRNSKKTVHKIPTETSPSQFKPLTIDSKLDTRKGKRAAGKRVAGKHTGDKRAGDKPDVDKDAEDKLKLALKLQKATKDLMNNRLDELMVETESACGRVQNGAGLSEDDIDALKGCLDNWRKAKVQSYEEEKRIADEARRQKEKEEIRRQEEAARRKQEEEERRKNEEEARKRREMEDAERKAKEERQRREEAERKAEEEKRLRREEEEKKKREEEERIRREKEEAERKAEEERQRLEEEERLRREEEERKKREEDERIEREAEEKRLRLEEERKQRDEEAARRKAEAQRRREEAKRERERKRKEEEERVWRQDPTNWEPVVYERECDEVDGRREYHGGISCVLTSPPGGIEKDDIECTASDEVDSVITVLEDDEKPVSSVINVQSNKDDILHSEVPSRLYIPHNRMLAPSDEIVIKISKDDNDWVAVNPVQPTQNMSELEKSAKRMAGVEVNDFTTLKLIVISRPKSQTIIVDKPGVSVYSTMDNNVKLFVPRDTFENETEVKMMVQTVTADTLSGLLKDNPTLENVLSVSSIMTLTSQKAQRKAVEVDLLKPTSKQATGSRFQRGKFYQLYACRDKAWRIADVEYKGQQNHVTVSLPVGLDKVTIMEIEVPANIPKDSVPGIAEALYTSINKTATVLVVKQKSSNPEMVAVRLVRKEDLEHIIDYLEEFGYDDGPGFSGDFKIKEGQAIKVMCTGNIEIHPEQNIMLEYMSYKDGAATMFNLKVKDVYKQKNLPSFVGNIRCMLLKDKHSDTIMHSVEMTVSLPKPVREKMAIGFVRVRFPYYLTSVASYLAKAVQKDDTIHWQSILKTLMGDKGFRSGIRNVRRKLEDSAEDSIIVKAMLLDWMKSQNKHTDKDRGSSKRHERRSKQADQLLKHDISQAKKSGAKACRQKEDENPHQVQVTNHQSTETVNIQSQVNLSDEVMKDISSEATRSARDIGRDLSLADSIIDKCIAAHSDDTHAQIEAVLIEWRESDDVLRHDNAQSYLRSVSG